LDVARRQSRYRLVLPGGAGRRGINTKSRDTFRPGGNAFMGTGYIESPEEPWQMYVRALDIATGKLQWEYKQVNSRRYVPDSSPLPAG
jgi:hypothetical protein